MLRFEEAYSRDFKEKRSRYTKESTELMINYQSY